MNKDIEKQLKELKEKHTKLCLICNSCEGEEKLYYYKLMQECDKQRCALLGIPYNPPVISKRGCELLKWLIG